MATAMLEDGDRLFLQALMLRRSGNHLPDHVDHLLSWRLKQVAWCRNFTGLEELLARLRDGAPAELEDEVVEQLLDTDTWFFRDESLFKAVHSVVLPDLLKSRGAEKFLKFWVPGAGSGQEAYSLILTVRHHFPAMKEWILRVLGTDVVESALEQARLGAYTDKEVQRGLPLTFLTRYFARFEDRWHLARPIRDEAVFKLANLNEPFSAAAPRFDLVSVRNLLRSFEPELRAGALDNAARQVASGGYLVLGGAELGLGLAPEPRVFRDLGEGLFKAFGTL
jgi:chemotaxis protein methyltransferase CheR